MSLRLALVGITVGVKEFITVDSTECIIVGTTVGNAVGAMIMVDEKG